jgi:hypothetical protein
MDQPEAEELYQQIRDRATPLIIKIAQLLEGESASDAALACVLVSLSIVKQGDPSMFGGWLSLVLRAAQEHFESDVVQHALIHCQQDVPGGN